MIPGVRHGLSSGPAIRRSRRWTMFTMFCSWPRHGAALTGSQTFRTFLLLLAATLGLLVPVAQLAGDGSSWRRCDGAVPGEILATRLGAGSWSTRSPFTGSSSWDPDWSSSCPDGGPVGLRPGGIAPGILAAALFFPATALVTWVGSNSVQAAVVWSGGPRNCWSAPRASSAWGPRWASPLWPTLPKAALVTMVLTAWGFAAREVAQAGTERPSRPPTSLPSPLAAAPTGPAPAERHLLPRGFALLIDLVGPLSAQASLRSHPAGPLPAWAPDSSNRWPGWS